MKNILILVVLSSLAGASFANNEVADKGRYYLKGIIGAGFGMEAVSLYMSANPEGGGDEQTVKLQSGGGLNMGLAGGYHLSDKYIVEAGFGYLEQTEDPEVKDADGEFTRLQLNASILRILNPGRKYQWYLGAGVDFFMAPELTRDAASLGIKNTVKYDPSAGIHAVAGMMTAIKESDKWFLFADLTYTGLVTFNWNEHRENGMEIEPFDDWKKLNGDQIFINFGILYYFR